MSFYVALKEGKKTRRTQPSPKQWAGWRVTTNRDLFIHGLFLGVGWPNNLFYDCEIRLSLLESVFYLVINES